MRISDSKQLEQFVRWAKAAGPADGFHREALLPQIEQFEQMQHFEKSIDRILGQKRTEIQEALACPPQTVETTLRLFLDPSISTSDNGETVVALNIFGRLVLQDEEPQVPGEFFHAYRTGHAFQRTLLKQFFFPDFVKELTVEFPDSGLAPARHSTSPDRLKKWSMTNHRRTGFAVVRALPEGLADPETLRCRVGLTLDGGLLKLKPPLARFLGKTLASRREVLDAIWAHVSAHRLFDKNAVRLDAALHRALGEQAAEGAGLRPDELSHLVWLLTEDGAHFSFECEVGAGLRVWDLAVSAQLEETSDCMAFFVQKLIFTEEDKELFLREENYNDFNAIITNNERANRLTEAIIKRFQKVGQRMAKREAFGELRRDPARFLEQFCARQRQNFGVMQQYGSGLLAKRAWADEQEFTELLAEDYEEVLDREIEAYLKGRSFGPGGRGPHN